MEWQETGFQVRPVRVHPVTHRDAASLALAEAPKPPSQAESESCLWLPRDSPAEPESGASSRHTAQGTRKRDTHNGPGGGSRIMKHVRLRVRTSRLRFPGTGESGTGSDRHPGGPRRPRLAILVLVAGTAAALALNRDRRTSKPWLRWKWRGDGRRRAIPRASWPSGFDTCQYHACIARNKRSSRV